jgi:hypothetical protein
MTFKFAMTASTAFAALAFVVAISAPSVASAADATKEVATANAHAGMAAGAANVPTVHAHLHHVVNCLVGPKGDGFDAKEANPCDKMGDGAIPDTTDAGAKKKLADAVTKAEAGIKADDLATATKAATDVQTDLK